MRCIIISGSPETDAEFIRKTVVDTDFVICADNGILYAQQAGVTPDLIVGDFDSYRGTEFPDCEKVTLNPQKDDTDTVHSVDIAIDRGYIDIVILGALGGRIDHTFANISALQYIHNKGGRGVLLSEKESVQFLPVGEYEFKGYKDKVFSLFPFGCNEVCVSYKDAFYPLEKYNLKSSVPMGVSNVFVSDNAEIKIYDGNAILIINLSEHII
jgi:thiamine pyrophosphokinase